MAVSTRTIRRRIKSVGNTKKITKAMELVAAAKMRKAVASAVAGRPYAEAARRAIADVATATDPSAHPLLRQGSGSRDLVLIFSTDRGLCGAVNARLFAELGKFLKGRDADFAVAGKKAQQWAAKRGTGLVASWPAFSNNPTAADVRPVAALAVSDFLAGKYGRVWIAATDFKSALTQTAAVRQLLPLSLAEAGPAGPMAEAQGDDEATLEPQQSEADSAFLFEPSARAVLDAVLPRLVESLVWQAALEASASEHSSRMLAMRSATDNAIEMIDDLTLAFNQARQAGITREIAEISAGAAALG
jgi:F-type H+-transporting ATPase subunit gamma